MSQYLYIPINSLNFNNILSTESISPRSFYEKRDFGFKRFESLIVNPYQNSLLGYDKIINIDDIKSDRQEFPFYLCIPKKYVSGKSEVFDKNKVKIYQIDRTIYINPIECFFLVRSEQEKKFLKAGTLRSMEVKNENIYCDRIYVSGNLGLHQVKWSDSLIDDISDLKISNWNAINEDQRINKIKGLLYGFLAGKVSEFSTEISEATQLFKKFINRYAANLNLLSGSSKGSYIKNRDFDLESINNNIQELINLKQEICFTLGIDRSQFIEDLIKEEFSINQNSIIELKNTRSLKSGKSIYSFVYDFYKSKIRTVLTIEDYLDLIIASVERFLANPTSKSYGELESDFEKYRSLIFRDFENRKEQEQKVNEVSSIPYEFNEDFDLVKTNLPDLDKMENEIYFKILKEFLSRFELSTSDEIAQERQSILTNIGKSIFERKVRNEKSLKNYLNNLFVNLKRKGSGFDINDIHLNSLKSLAFFLLRFNDFEKLIDHMEKNEFYEKSLTFGIWGVSYGFANTSKLILNPIGRNHDNFILLTNFFNQNLFGRELDPRLLEEFLDSNKISKTQPAPTKEFASKAKSEMTSPSKSENYGGKVLDKSSKIRKEEPEAYDLFSQTEITPPKDAVSNSYEDESPVTVELNASDNKEESMLRNAFFKDISSDGGFDKPEWKGVILNAFNRYEAKVQKSKVELGIGTRKELFENFLKECIKERNIAKSSSIRFGAKKIQKTILIFQKYLG